MAKNPYRPGVGLNPPYLAGREGEQRRFLSTLRAAPEIPANVRLTGLRGVGKTVLLNRLNDLAGDENWATVILELEPRHNTDRGLADTLVRQLNELETKLSAVAKVRETLSRGVEAARRLVKVSYNGVDFSVAGDFSGEAAEIGKALIDTTNAGLVAGRDGLVLLIDEAQILRDERNRQGEHPLSLLIAAVSALQKVAFPVAMVLCGLPTLAVNLLAARTYSERMFKGEEVASLAADEARAAFVEPLHESGVAADSDLVDAVLAAVDGYPYFLQLWGAELWEAAVNAGVERFDSRLLELTEPEIYRRLDLDFYAPRVESLTPAEQDLLSDSAKCHYPPIVVAELNSHSPKSGGNVNVLLGRLVEANILYRPRKGQYLYTAPGFHDYLLRRVEAQR